MLADPNYPQWVADVLQLVEIVGALLGAAGGLLWFVARRSMVTKEEMAKHETEHGEVHDRIEARFQRGEERFNALSTSIANLPGRPEHEAMKVQLVAVDRAVGQLSTQLNGVEQLLIRIERPLNIMVEEKLRGNA